MNDKLVSVNLTTYNRANLLQRALDSILVQTYPKMEVIIVDDCSEDNTTEVVNNYMEKDPRIKYFRHEKNQGNAKARNTALSHSTGYYIAFMDDDDEWIDNYKLDKQVEIFENSKENIGVVCSSVLLIEEKGNSKAKTVEKPKNLKKHILGGNGIIYSPTVLTKREILEEVGGFDDNMKKGVDSEFYRTCIVKLGYDVNFMSDVTTAIYECGSDRMTTIRSEKDIDIALSANLYLIRKYIAQYLLSPLVLTKRLKKIIFLLVKKLSK